MHVLKPMCWCLKVSFSVFSNLTDRFLVHFLDAVYAMCSLCFCGSENSDPQISELKDREEFYKEVSRDTAENLLKSRQNGTFIIRPSKNGDLGTLSIVQDGKIFHLNIRRRQDGNVALGTEKEDERAFQDINSLINYYISNYLVLYSKGEKTRTLLLPYRDKTVI